MRKILVIAGLWGSLWSTGALATNPILTCFFSFGTLLPGGADPNPLIVSTYLDLIEQVGARLDAATVRELAENPFKLKETGKTDFLTLIRQLKQLEKMLASREWNTPHLRELIKHELEQRARELDKVAKNSPEQLRRLRQNRPLFVPPDASALSYSADGNWAAGRTSSHLYLADIPNRLTHHIALPPKLYGVPQFSPDGKSLLFTFPEGGAENHVTRVSLLPNGVPDWNNRREMMKSAAINKIEYTNSPNVTYGLSGGARPFLQRLDIDAGTAVKIRFEGTTDGEFTYGLGVIPGTAMPYIVVKQADGSVVLLYGTPDADGVVRAVKTGPTLDQPPAHTPESIRFTPDGKRIVWVQRNADSSYQAYVAPLRGGKRQGIAPQSGFDFGQSPVWIEAGTNQSAYIFLPDFQSQRTLVRRLDLDQAKELGSTLITHVMDEFPTWTADGERLLFREAKTKLTILGIDNLNP